MKHILITGATGNVGVEVIRYLLELNSESKVIAAVRNIDKAGSRFKDSPGLSFRQFDFEKSDAFKTAFSGIDYLFLLRPPHISDVEAFFRPLLNTARESGIENIIFLSVQGAEKSKVIPHNKIERLIKEFGFNYIFVRPGYFMQNLTTTLLPEIVNNRSITLPSGNAKFNWIDVKNIGEATARLILDFESHQNKAYEITGTENKDFAEVTALMTTIIGEEIRFKSMNPVSFYLKKKREGMKSGFALVMTLLHFLPRLQGEPAIFDNYQNLTGKRPTTLEAFIQREKAKLSPS